MYEKLILLLCWNWICFGRWGLFAIGLAALNLATLALAGLALAGLAWQDWLCIASLAGLTARQD